ncbi:MAG: CAP domain-containing protein [Defluviitaleaceae bacterium]|nr:CAP domain-containing protein [Defluviitaleaceae bacterium]
MKNFLLFAFLFFSFSGPETDLLIEINKARVAQGVPALAINHEAARLARYRTEEMVALDFFGHGSRLYGEPDQMLVRFGVPFMAAGVNIAKGQDTAEEVAGAWLSSPEHAQILLNKNFTSAGIGLSIYDDMHYWTIFLISDT